MFFDASGFFGSALESGGWDLLFVLLFSGLGLFAFFSARSFLLLSFSLSYSAGSGFGSGTERVGLRAAAARLPFLSIPVSFYSSSI